MTARADIVSASRQWLGTRWHHQASVKGVGCDCIGLVAGVARSLGLQGGEEFANDPAVKGYGREPDVEMLLAACNRYLIPIDLRAALMGDIYLMNFNGQPRHFAIISRRYPDQLVHAYAQARKVVENGMNAVWQARLHSAWSYKGISG